MLNLYKSQEEKVNINKFYFDIRESLCTLIPKPVLYYYT